MQRKKLWQRLFIFFFQACDIIEIPIYNNSSQTIASIVHSLMQYWEEMSQFVANSNAAKKKKSDSLWEKNSKLLAN